MGFISGEHESLVKRAASERTVQRDAEQRRAPPFLCYDERTAAKQLAGAV